MAKLWDKGCKLDTLAEEFTVGEDYIIDKELVEVDLAGSMAHAKMLEKIGILSQSEFTKIKTVLKEILKLHANGKFEIKKEDEDVHTAIENYLTKKLGETGKKIHTARSRNDQVLVDLRLFTKGKLLKLESIILELADALIDFAEKNKEVPIPGRTHTQLAMPSSVGLWAGAYAESLLDDLELLKKAYKLNDQCPLGSAASYGVSLPIDRQMVADLLGFSKVQNNVLYANNSRGKIESIVLAALSQVMIDLSKLASDLILFTIPELGYFELPEEFCTGSSIMPNKKNPDVLELVRAKSGKVLSGYNQVLFIIKDLPSGYNRDFQETKEPLMEGLKITTASVNVCKELIGALKVNKSKCLKACVVEIFATDKATRLAVDGMPWREAYLKVSKELDRLPSENPIENIKAKKHIGATGNLGLDKAKLCIVSTKKELLEKKQELDRSLMELMV